GSGDEADSKYTFDSTKCQGILNAALEYIEYGLSVIPIDPKSKRPLIQWKEFQSRIASDAEVEAWWSKWPDANLGIVTGAVSGVIAIDADGPEGLRYMETECQQTPIHSITGKGRHALLKHPGFNVQNATRVLPEIDIRGDGGYIVAPPSIHHETGKQYQWEFNGLGLDELDELPAYEPIQPVNGSSKPKDGIDLSGIDVNTDTRDGVGEGHRNDSLAKLAGRWIGKGLPFKDVLIAARGWNQSNTPPMPDDEVKRTVQSIWSAEQRKQSASKAAADDLWTAEDADCHIRNISKSLNGDVSTLEVIPVVEDILLYQDFSPLETDLIRSSLKNHLKISKKTTDEILSVFSPFETNATGDTDNEGGGGLDPDEATHIEMVDDIFFDMAGRYQRIVGAEGALWLYGPKTDGLYIKHDLTRHETDIARRFPAFKNCKRGSDYRAMSRLQYYARLEEQFFSSASYGLPGKSKFYRIGEDSITPVSYSLELKQRWKLSVDPAWQYDPASAPMLNRFLSDSLDAKQQMVLQECFGALLTGTMKNLQKAVLLKGSGENGKSVVLDLLSNIINPELRCAIGPEKMDEDYFKALLAGKIVNIVGEVEKSKPIRADFKDIIACDTPLTARVIYREPISFLPQCGHIFSTNEFPMTKDHSDGFYRRWAVILFENKVDPKRKIPRLGEKIARHETPQVLAWAIEGALRLMKNRFVLTETPQHLEQMKQWKNAKDSVFSFLLDDEVLVMDDTAGIEKQALYKLYSHWCRENAGVKAVGRNVFYERVSLKFPETKISKSGRRVFVGIGVTEWMQGGALIKRHDTSKNNGIEYYSSVT
ncbi:MAG: bifunctional DNA primase/polymerase, partial [Desulfamplus sp.]|nr:bifunctional DNA primase/polymerase [Desulfamplus sp.]